MIVMMLIDEEDNTNDHDDHDDNGDDHDNSFKNLTWGNNHGVFSVNYSTAHHSVGHDLKWTTISKSPSLSPSSP